MYLTLKDFLLNNQDDASFGGGIEEKTIEEMENVLSLVFPNEYRLFLKDFGGVSSIFSRRILGYSKKSNRMLVVDLTLEYREKGLPNNYILLEDVDGICYVLNCNNGEVYLFNRFSKKMSETKSLFSEYYLDILNSAKEDWENF